jgi:hypothetical protein
MATRKHSNGGSIQVRNGQRYSLQVYGVGVGVSFAMHFDQYLMEANMGLSLVTSAGVRDRRHIEMNVLPESIPMIYGFKAKLCCLLGIHFPWLP